MTARSKKNEPVVSIIMGSKSDWPTMEIASQTLDEFGVDHETKIVSAHRTPDLLFEFAKSAEERGIEVIIAGAGGAAHLPGMIASLTPLPVIGVPVKSHSSRNLFSKKRLYGSFTYWGKLAKNTKLGTCDFGNCVTYLILIYFPFNEGGG